MTVRQWSLACAMLMALPPRLANATHGPPSWSVASPQEPPVPRADTASRDSARGSRGRRPSVRVSGYVHVFYKGRRDANGDGVVEPGVFRVQRARIEFRGDVTRHVGYDLEIDPRAPDITGILRDAFISLDYVPHHEIRIGQQKTMFGYENPASSSRLFVVNRSEVSDRLSRGINLRDVGVGVVGSVPLGSGFRFEDALTVVNGSGLNVQADSTGRKNVWGRFGARYRHAGWTVRFGVSAASGDLTEPADSGPPAVAPFTFTFTRLGAGLEIDHPRVFFAAEYVSGDDRAPASIPGAGGHRSGYYVIAVGKTRWGVGPLLRYDASDDFQRWTVGAFAGLPTSPASLLLNYEMFQDGLGTHDDRFYLRLQVRF